jgi:hypothetical protein
MPIINPDLSEVNKPLEPNTYPAEISAPIDMQVSKAGNPMIVIPFVLNNNGKNVKRTVRQVITGAGAFGFEQLLRATGFDDVANSLKSGNPQPFDTDKLVGQKLNVTVETDTYNGQLTDKITGYLKA